MFAREELIEKSSLLAGKPKPLIEVIEFTPDDFLSIFSEECIVICRGSQYHFESAVHFWISTQQYIGEREEYFLPYLDEAVCEPIAEQEFVLMLNQTCALKYPLVITPKGKYIWGQRMANEWNDFSALAEFEHEYLSFNWTTTA